MQTFAVAFAWTIIPYFSSENEVLMERFGWDTVPHRRFNPLSGEWLLVSPHRTRRPWSGQEELVEEAAAPRFDPACYLCPGNARAGGETNPDYDSTFVFTNDFGALLPTSHPSPDSDPNDELLKAKPETGSCRVICYSPRHDLTMARMAQPLIERVISTWQDEFACLGSSDEINHVQVFENRGLMMGCSNPHPHGQIWATSTTPNIPATESRQQREYMQRNGCCLLCSYLERELNEGVRIVFSNSSFVVLVPFWAVWPFETMILPRRHGSSIASLTQTEKSDLAEIMKRLAICYDNLFQTSFPYSMGIHQRPTDGNNHPYWHFHFHYLPPLLRSSTVKKHMVGFELLAMPQRDLTAEIAAERLRGLPTLHFREKQNR